jgi:hypothetical protein
MTAFKLCCCNGGVNLRPSTVAVLQTLRLSMRRRLHTCFALWKWQMQRRLGMEAMAMANAKRNHSKGVLQTFYVWREEAVRRKRQRETAKRVMRSIMGKGLLLDSWLKWRQAASDTLRSKKAGPHTSPPRFSPLNLSRFSEFCH